MRVMGQDPMGVKDFREYLRVVRALLAGEEVDYTYNGKTRDIAFIHRDRHFINLDQPIPIYVAANGPLVLQATGAYGDGWMTVSVDSNEIAAAQNLIEKGANQAGRTLPNNFHKAHKKIKIKSNISKSKFKNIVLEGKKYIKKGDIFQVVLSQRFQASIDKPPLEIYNTLRILNPSPFMFYFNYKDFQILGSSPEILVRLLDDKITIRPIAGTRPRGKNKLQDKKLISELLKDPKELAEHLMLLDLGRNDVGKAAKIGSVKVTEKFKIEKYSHVMHIVSNVMGKLNKKFSTFETFLSGFPAGTVSGAPKIRAMEIIDELESSKRKLYAGGIGYFTGKQEFDTCIALRTALIKDKKIYVQSGAGIVADSNPEKEYNETVNKAKALLKAIN